MAVYTDAYLSIDSNDLSAYLQSLELLYEAETVDDTAMGDTARSSAGGLKNWTITANFHNSFAADELDSILFAKVGTAVSIEVRPTADAVGAGNPKFTGTGLLSAYTPLSGSVGDQLTVPVTIVAAGTLTRATS